MPTQLIFQPPEETFLIPVGQTMTLGTINVQPYQQIRVVLAEYKGSPGNVVFNLIISLQGSAWGTLDTVTLSPEGNESLVYDVPGTELTIMASAVGPGTGSVRIYALVFGYSS